MIRVAQTRPGTSPYRGHTKFALGQCGNHRPGPPCELDCAHRITSPVVKRFRAAPGPAGMETVTGFTLKAAWPSWPCRRERVGRLGTAHRICHFCLSLGYLPTCRNRGYCIFPPPTYLPNCSPCNCSPLTHLPTRRTGSTGIQLKYSWIPID